MKARIFTLLMVVALALSLVSAVAAQDGVCFNLSADDCAVLQAAEANAPSVQSFTQNYTFSLSITGVPDSADVNVTSSGAGPFVLTGTGDLPFAMAMDVVGAMVDGTSDQSGEISFVIVDDVIYVQNPETSAWEGITAEQALAAFAQGFNSAGAPFSFEDALSGNLGALGMDDPAMAGMMAQSAALAEVPGFLTMERLANETLNGQDTIPFAFTIDFGTLISSAEFQAMLAAMGDSEDPNMAQMAAMAPVLPMLVQNGTVTLTRWYGASDNLPYRMTVAVDASVNIAAMMGGGSETPPIVLDMDLAVDLTNVNSTSAPVAPEGATISEG